MSRALVKFVRVSPTKARLIAREVQGMNAELALASLDFMPNKAAGIISKAIASAVANGSYEPEEVTVLSCRVDKAAVMKRWRPRARGSASKILKPTSHILVEVGKPEIKAAPKAEPKKEVKSVKAESKPAKKETVKKTAPKVEAKTETKKAAPKKAAAPKAKTETKKAVAPKAKSTAKKAETATAQKPKKAPVKKAAPKAKKSDGKDA